MTLVAKPMRFMTWVALLPIVGLLCGFWRGSGVVSVGTPFSITYESNNTNAASQSAYTFSGQAIGTADPTRIVVVCVGWNSSGGSAPISSMTIGGASASQATGAYQTDPFNTGGNTDIWYAPLATGTTATVIVNLTGTPSRLGIGVYNVTGTSASFSTASGNATAASSVTSLSATLTEPTGGGVIGIMYVHATGITISGSNLTMDITDLNIGVAKTSIGLGNDTSHNGSNSFGFTFASNQGTMSVAAWNP